MKTEDQKLPAPCRQCRGVDWVSTSAGAFRCSCPRGLELTLKDAARRIGVRKSAPAKRKAADDRKMRAAGGDR